MRHIVWLAGCLLVLSCTLNNDNLNGGTGGAPATGGQTGTGGAGGCPRCVGTGGAPATGGQTGSGGAVATGGQPGTGGQPSGGQTGTGGSATGGHSGGGTGGSGTGGGQGGGGQGGESCDALESDYAKAFTAAKKCTLGAPGQCQQLVNSSLSCPGCKQYVNDTTMLDLIQTEWTNQGCGSVPHVCPAIACIVPTQSSCTSSPTSGGPNAGADSSGTCAPGVLTPAN